MNQKEKEAKKLYDEEVKDLPVFTRKWEDLDEEVKEVWLEKITNQKE